MKAYIRVWQKDRTYMESGPYVFDAYTGEDLQLALSRFDVRAMYLSAKEKDAVVLYCEVRKEVRSVEKPMAFRKVDC